MYRSRSFKKWLNTFFLLNYFSHGILTIWWGAQQNILNAPQATSGHSMPPLSYVSRREKIMTI